MATLYPISADETGRLEALHRLQILDSDRTPDFDAVLALALEITRCRTGVIGFMDNDRHWFKAKRGVDGDDFPRDISLGNYTLLQSEPFFIEDVASDERFRHGPLVTERGVRFYAGVALGVPGGHKVGTLCLTDRKPRAATPALHDALGHLQRIIESLIEAHLRAVQARIDAKRAEENEREIWQKTRLVAQTERLARVGSFELDVDSGRFRISEEGYRIHEIEPGTALMFDDILAQQSPEIRERIKSRVGAAIANGVGYEVTSEILTAKGHLRWVQLATEVEKVKGRIVRVFGSLRDVTEEYDAKQNLWRAAHFDTLTNVPNRYSWNTELVQAFDRAAADSETLSILIFDLDGFKEINDTRGHSVGDIVLRTVAERMSATLPQGSFHARLGGDEFAILLKGPATPSALERIARRVHLAIQTPIDVGGVALRVSGTFGGATFPADAATADDLMKKADMALYQAKRSPQRSAFVSFRPEIGGLFDAKRQAIECVAAALDSGRLVPFYQPKVDLKTTRILGFEALCRIEAADGTILGPAHFHLALRDPASAARVGRAMLEFVTADIVAWRRDGFDPGRIAVNVTGADFADGKLARRVLARLRSLGLPTSALEIEVTENTILGEQASTVGLDLTTLRDHGVVVSLDDFGTGYASLTHLRDAPISCIKLDRSFVADLGRTSDSAIIVKSVVDLGHDLDMRVVAEGIEKQRQAEFLRSIGCDEAQGFLFGRPASRKATRAMLEKLGHFSIAPDDVVQDDIVQDDMAKAG